MYKILYHISLIYYIAVNDWFPISHSIIIKHINKRKAVTWFGILNQIRNIIVFIFTQRFGQFSHPSLFCNVWRFWSVLISIFDMFSIHHFRIVCFSQLYITSLRLFSGNHLILRTLLVARLYRYAHLCLRVSVCVSEREGAWVLIYYESDGG